MRAERQVAGEESRMPSSGVARFVLSELRSLGERGGRSRRDPAKPIASFGGLRSTSPEGDILLSSPAVASRRFACDAGLVVAGSVAVAIAAQVAVPFPGSPVPVTAQTFALLLVGIGLGARRGAMALALYLLEGAAGLPVFAGGAGGPAAFVGPTAGYLLAFPLAALVAGAFASPRSAWPRVVAASLASHAVIFAFGLAWLARFVGPGQLIAVGLVPFLPGEGLKITATVLTFRAIALTRASARPTH